MLDFLLNIDNKEVLIEILNHSIDFLIGNRDESHTLKLCHKYGQSPDDFLLTTRKIAQCYRNCCLEGVSIDAELSDFAQLSPSLQSFVPSMLAARKPEIMNYLIRCHNAQVTTLVESFDWDVRFVMGDSSFAQNRRQLATVTFDCYEPTGKRSSLHIEMNREKIDEFIAALDQAVKTINAEHIHTSLEVKEQIN